MVDVIELVNEPGGFLGSNWAAAIRQFFLDGYDAVRKAAGAGIKIMISDAFLTVDVRVAFFYYLCVFFGVS
jgi:glucan 1,3-beta-glucosidase